MDQSTGGANQGAIPTFSYLSTGMSAWLCRSSTTTMNNSSPQGQIFYANIGQSNSPPSYAVYAVDNCPGSEAVGGGNVPGYQVQIFHGTVVGSTAITDDMIGIPPNVPAGCTHTPH
ncbi:MAG TPA: hypothetical protein VE377_09910 [Candidatus Dormibacteraeota bacterium]|nr:hypothetical protein [Candidatus Dormibacteraeota bacterium]